jgi:sortase (surface protein transpeptidase)
MTTAARTGTAVIRWRVTAAALVLLAAVCLVIWSDRPSVPPAAGAAAPPTSTLTSSTPASDLPVAEPVALRPVQLSIPALDLDTRLITLGVHPDRTVEVPDDPDRAGWFRRGTVPGSVGSAVILGHVDSVDGPAVFAELSSLTTGARVAITMDDGSVVTFVVRSVTTYDNEAFPARLVYGSHGRRELNLVTCGGAYDADEGGYQANVVVNARWLSTV